MRTRSLAARVLLLAALAELAGACGQQSPPPPPRLRLALPAGAPATAPAAAAPLLAALRASTHDRVELSVPESPAALAAALRAGRLDAAFLTPQAYTALAADAPVRVVAAGALPPAVPVLICGQSSGVTPLSDGASWAPLRGKSVLFGPSDSLARNAWPRYFMAKNGVLPVGDLGSVRVVPDERQSLFDVYNGIADCTTAASDSRAAIADIAPDAAQRLVVVFTAPGPVPPPPVAVRTNLERGLRQHLAAALVAVKPGSPASSALAAVAGYPTLRAAGDGDYTVLRAVLGQR